MMMYVELQRPLMYCVGKGKDDLGEAHVGKV